MGMINTCPLGDAVEGLSLNLVAKLGGQVFSTDALRLPPRESKQASQAMSGKQCQHKDAAPCEDPPAEKTLPTSFRSLASWTLQDKFGRDAGQFNFWFGKIYFAFLLTKQLVFFMGG